MLTVWDLISSYFRQDAATKIRFGSVSGTRQNPISKAHFLRKFATYDITCKCNPFVTRWTTSSNLTWRFFVLRVNKFFLAKKKDRPRKPSAFYIMLDFFHFDQDTNPNYSGAVICGKVHDRICCWHEERHRICSRSTPRTVHSVTIWKSIIYIY